MNCQPPRITGRAGKGTLVLRALHLAVPAILITAVIWAVGAGDVLSRLRSADPAWLLAALLACSAQVLLSAMRWRLTAARLGADIPVWGAISEYYLSSAINTTVPGGVVGDAVRAVRTRGGAGLERAAQAVMIERLAGQVTLGAVLLAGLAISGRSELQASAVLAALALAGTGACILALSRTGARRAIPAVIRRFLAAIARSWFGPGAAVGQIALSLGVVAANIAAFGFAALAAGVRIGLPEALFAVPLILFAMLMPLSVAGWGYREGAAAAVFPLIGASPAEGVSASVLFGAVILAASLPGLAVLASWQGWRGERAAHREPAE